MFKFREIVKKQEFYLFADAGENLGNLLLAGHYIKETYRDTSYQWFYNNAPILNQAKSDYLDKIHKEYIEEVCGKGSLLNLI